MRKFHFKETENIRRRLIEIEANKMVFENTTVLPEIEENIRRKSLLKSSIFSARIEGNPMTVDNLTSAKGAKKMEIQNLLKAYRLIYIKEKPVELTKKTIRALHSTVMNNLSNMAGKFRQEPWAIYNSAGFVVYLAPSYFEVPSLMDEFVDYVNKLPHHPVINAAIAQFVLEKIHPFADGNGRVGRLISALVLRKYNFHFRGILPFEEYTDNNRQEYYYALEPSSDMTEFVEYFLTSIVFAGKEMMAKISQIPSGIDSNKRGLLAPRREEIINIIADHPLCSFEFLSRRFSAVNPKTLHYDLKKLQEMNYIEKAGTTRGSLYKIKE